MLRRFVAASAIASVVIACGTLAILLIPVFSLQRAYLLPVVWCFVPLAWGLWAMAAPASWVPQRFPQWGAALGLLAGVFALFILDMPSRILGRTIAAGFRTLALLFAVIAYYLMWMLVRLVYRKLSGPLVTR